MAESPPIRVLLVDNYDSFTFNIYQQLCLLGRPSQIGIQVKRNDDPELLHFVVKDWSAVVLSPGPGTPLDTAHSKSIFLKAMGKIPILGICLGHQLICSHYLATVSHALRPVHGYAEDIIHNGVGLFKGVKSPTKVARYHSLIVEKETLSPELEISAESQDGEIMAVKHKTLPIYGLQFHPESFLTPEGDTIMSNFLYEVTTCRSS